jgi:hypothetical protein
VSTYEVRLVRASLVWLVLTGALGVLFYLAPALAGPFRTTHVHMGAVGFLLSMVMGVAYWMMPRPGGMRQERAEALTFFCLHGGMLLRVATEPAWRATASAWLEPLVLLSGLLTLTAIGVFAFAMNRRVVTMDEIKRRRARVPSGPEDRR